MRRPVEAYVELVLRHRLAVVLILLLVTGVAGWICTRAVISSSLAGIFFGNSPRYLRYVERAKEFGSDDFIVVAFEDEDLLGEKTLGRLDKALRRIEVLPDVGRVSSLLDAQRMPATRTRCSSRGMRTRPWRLRSAGGSSSRRCAPTR